MKTLSRTFTVAGFATLLTAFVGATAAQAASSAILPDEGTLLGDGAGVSISVDFDCDAGWSANVWVEAAQRTSGDKVATGMGYSTTVDCAAGEESVDVVLLAGAGAALTVIAVAFPVWYFNRKMRTVYKAIRDRLGDLSAKLQENLSGMLIIKAFARVLYRVQTSPRYKADQRHQYERNQHLYKGEALLRVPFRHHRNLDIRPSS